MNPRTARTRLACHGPSEMTTNRHCRKAVTALEKSDELRRDFERQVAVDEKGVSGLRAIPVPETISEELRALGRQAVHAPARSRFNPRDPAMLSVTIGFLLMVGLLTWHFLGRAGVFPEEALTIAAEGVKLRTEQFEVVEEPAGALEDWFLLKGFDRFRVPPEFARYEAAGARIFKVENQPVAVLAVPENMMFFLIFDPAPLGISIAPEGSWRLAEFDYKYAAALREDKGVCFLVVIRGKKAELEAILKKKN